MDRPADIRLREHFRWTLNVNFCGGDIRDDYEESTIRTVMESLGTLGNEDEVAPLENPLWQSELRKELLQAHLESSLSS